MDSRSHKSVWFNSPHESVFYFALELGTLTEEKVVVEKDDPSPVESGQDDKSVVEISSKLK